jgi:hypothetical protein
LYYIIPGLLKQLMYGDIKKRVSMRPVRPRIALRAARELLLWLMRKSSNSSTKRLLLG